MIRIKLNYDYVTLSYENGRITGRFAAYFGQCIAFIISFEFVHISNKLITISLLYSKIQDEEEFNFQP